MGHLGLDNPTLRETWLAGERCKFLFFWGHTPPADGHVNESCLSQWWMSRFFVDGVEYTCAERCMMAEKARMFGDGEMLEKIISPKEMKAYGRAVPNFDQAVWRSRCYERVLVGNMAKFGQNPMLWGFPSGTKGRILVEASPRDRIWGIGMGKQNPNSENPTLWRGKNLLGFALTETRELLERR